MAKKEDNNDNSSPSENKTEVCKPWEKSGTLPRSNSGPKGLDKSPAPASAPINRQRPGSNVSDTAARESFDMEKFKQEILEEVRKELQKVKDEIIGAFIEELQKGGAP